MNKYDYREAVKEDAKAWILEEIEYTKDADYAWLTMDNLDEEESELFERMWVADSVTGNASGSYTFSRWTAEENICHNMDLALEAYREFGYDGIADDEAERIDVTIRCYLLCEAIAEAIEEIKAEA